MKFAQILLALLIFCSSYAARAEAVRLELSVVGEPIKSWVLTLNGGRSQLISAKFHRDGEKLIIEAAANNAEQIAGVVQLSNGKIISSPLKKIDNASDPSSSNKSGHSAPVVQSRIQELESELAELQASKRREAGLDRVDQIFEQVAKIDDEITALKDQIRQAEAWR